MVLLWVFVRDGLDPTALAKAFVPFAVFFDSAEYFLTGDRLV